MVSQDQLKFLLSFVNDIVPPRFLRTLFDVAGQYKEFYSQAIEISRSFHLSAIHPEVVNSDFEAFLELLKSASVSSEAFQFLLR